jgi:hypothetical protein
MITASSRDMTTLAIHSERKTLIRPEPRLPVRIRPAVLQGADLSTAALSASCPIARGKMLIAQDPNTTARIAATCVTSPLSWPARPRRTRGATARELRPPPNVAHRIDCLRTAGRRGLRFTESARPGDESHSIRAIFAKAGAVRPESPIDTVCRGGVCAERR